jgi:hypothetical protein
MEALDRTDDIPLLIPSIHMYRVRGKAITKSHWVALRIAPPEKAAEWRAKSRPFFQEGGKDGELKAIPAIAGKNTSPPGTADIDPQGYHPAAKLYRALRDTVLGEAQPFSSFTFPQDDQEEEEINW